MLPQESGTLVNQGAHGFKGSHEYWISTIIRGFFYQKVSNLPINKPMWIMILTMLKDHSLLIKTLYTYLMLSRRRFFNNNAFLLYDFYSHVLAQYRLPRGSWIFNFGIPFINNQFFMHKLSLIKMHLHIWLVLYDHVLAQRPLSRGS